MWRLVGCLEVELPGANTQGATIDEAREYLRQAAQMILEDGDVEPVEREATVGGGIREALTVSVY